MQQNHTDDTKRIVRNTLLLYLRMAVMLFISLFTSRVILSTLGVSNYGVYNAVGGFVGLFSLMSGALTNAVSRFLTFELGKGDTERLQRVFATSVNVMVVLSVIVIVVGEIFGLWFLTEKVNIPPDRLSAAKWVFQCSMVTFVVGLLSVPYNSLLVAHERMGAFAYISILQVMLQLGIIYLLHISPIDKLITYSTLLLAVSLLIRFIYASYCNKHFKESVYQFIIDKSLLKQMTGFAGWNFFAQGAYVLNSQGVNLLLNIFFGVTVNAARGVAQNVSDKVAAFAGNFTMALNPQITKSFACGDYQYMHSPIFRGARFSYYLMLLFAVPLILEMDMVLGIWLETVPDYAALFARWTLVLSLVNLLSSQLIVGLHASGNIKRYMIIVGSFEVLCAPATYLAFKSGLPVVWAYYINFAFYFALLFIRLYLIKDLIYLSASEFLKKVVLNVVVVSALSFAAPAAIVMLQDDSLLRFVEVCAVGISTTAIAVLYAGMSRNEREKVLATVRRRLPFRTKQTEQ